MNKSSLMLAGLFAAGAMHAEPRNPRTNRPDDSLERIRELERREVEREQERIAENQTRYLREKAYEDEIYQAAKDKRARKNAARLSRRK